MVLEVIYIYIYICRDKGVADGLEISDLMPEINGGVTVVPVHPGEEIGRGLLSKILRDVGLTREVYLRLLSE